MSQSNQLKIKHTRELTVNPNGQTSFQDKQSVEVTRDTIQSGLLKNLPGSLLHVYLYIVTNINAEFTLNTTSDEISNLLPCTPLEIETALAMLERQKYISLEQSDGKYTIALISADLNNHNFSVPQNTLNSKDNTEKSVVSKNNQLIDYILGQKIFSEEDLVRAISSMMPAQNLNYGFRQEVEYWFKTFDKEVIKELIRRTDEAWQRDPDLNCQAYMRKIANEWLADQICTISDLEASDKVFRQIKILLEEFGIERQKEMTRTHWSTVYRWINSESKDDFALSTEVARFAIQEAIRRKSDGRPSLTYIEGNFIKPFKENKIKTVEEAMEFLNQKPDSLKTTTDKTQRDKSDTKKYKWQLDIDYTRFREN